MGESIISRSSSGSGKSSGDYVLMTKIYTKNQVFVVPDAKDQSFSVRIFGGGGAGAILNNQAYIYGGGGGGWMNNGIFTLNSGDDIPIIIGTGGKAEMVMYNIIPSMAYGNSGGTSFFGSLLSANGGGAAITNSPGSGGSGGGGCNIRSNAGVGFQFGGGGGWGGKYSNSGNGGMWGGGGGGGSGYSIGGTYGGNGGSQWNNATNGTNTLGNSSIPIHLRGPGLSGDIIANNTYFKFGGGGGYGGNGGICGGGGGGYGADGGNYGGGGGGYGGKGGDWWGGGGSYGPGGDGIINNNANSWGEFGGGGGVVLLPRVNHNATYSSKGGDGICIIQYYAPTISTGFDELI